jgi:hypothetical protein
MNSERETSFSKCPLRAHSDFKKLAAREFTPNSQMSAGYLSAKSILWDPPAPAAAVYVLLCDANSAAGETAPSYLR